MILDPAVHPLDHESPADRPSLRVWPALVIVALFWAVMVISMRLEVQMFFRFLGQTAVLLLVLLTFVVWWLRRRQLPRGERWLAVGAMFAAVAVAMVLAHKSMGIMPI